MALSEAERQLEERHTPVLNDLQQWLQLTYEIETRYFEAKREAAERQLRAAKELVGWSRKFFAIMATYSTKFQISTANIFRQFPKHLFNL